MARRRRAARLLALPLLNAHAHTSASAAYAMRSFAPNYAPHSVAENALAGAHRTEWDVNGAGDLALQGFAREQRCGVRGARRRARGQAQARASICVGSR